jgi:ATP-dependent DNA helicase 2 subunit 2
VLFNLRSRVVIDALIVGITTQDLHLAKKKTWTRKIVLVTDGESPVELEDWEVTVKRMNDLGVSLTVVYVECYFLPDPCLTHLNYRGVDFDDEEYGFVEEDKSIVKVGIRLLFPPACTHIHPILICITERK